MNWRDLAEKVGKIAPVLGAALGGPAGGAIGALISTAIGTENSPQAVAAALIADPSLALKLKEIEANLEIAKLNAEVAQQSEVQQTARVEAQSEDEFVRRTRPGLARKSAYAAFGYALVTGLVFPLVDATLPETDPYILYALFSPCLSYMGFRTADGFSKRGKH